MSYAWQDQAEAAQAARIPEGEHRVQILKIVYGTNKDGPFFSKHGDPQILLVFQDEQAREASLFVTLSDRAAFVLARLMGCCDPPINLKRMEEDGIDPVHFAEAEFADAQLVGRHLTIQVTDEGEGRFQVTPIKVQASTDPPAETPPAPPRPRTPAKPAARDDAPPSSTDDAPPETPPTAGMTKDEAWAAVLAAWSTNADPEAKNRRNAGWLQAIKAVGKPEPAFTPADWAKVAEGASLPF